MTQATSAERYRATVKVKSVRPNFPPGSGSLIEVEDKQGKIEQQLHFRGLVEDLQTSAKLPAEKWPGTEWEYDFFDHRLLKLLKA